MVWYDVETNEVVDECCVCEYIARNYTENDHRENLKDNGMDPNAMSETDFRCSYVDELDYFESEMNRDHVLGLDCGLAWAECKCEKCGRMFEDETELDEDGIEDEVTYLCPDCGYSGHIIEFGKRFSKYLQKPI